MLFRSHEHELTDQTADNILRTLSSLDIQSAEPQLTAATRLTTSKPTSKSPLVAATIVISLAVLAFLLFKGDSTQKDSTASANANNYKSTVDLYVVTVKDKKEEIYSSDDNQSLKDDLVSKLSLFRDYKIIQGNAIAADSNAEEYINFASRHNSDFIIQANYNNKGTAINAKVIDAFSGRVVWTKKIIKEINESEIIFLDKATNIIAANIAGYDGCIHREILQSALSKNYDDLTAVELLQLGKSVWEDVN